MHNSFPERPRGAIDGRRRGRGATCRSVAHILAAILLTFARQSVPGAAAEVEVTHAPSGNRETGLPRQEAAQVRAIVEGYENNRQAFGQLKCEYSVTFGTSRSWSDAIGGRYDSAIAVRKKTAVVVRDGAKMRSDLICESALGGTATAGSSSRPGPRVPTGDRPEREAGTFCASARHLSDGEICFTWSIEAGGAGILRPQDDRSGWGPEISPFSMGVTKGDDADGFYRKTVAAIGRSYCSYGGEEVVDGRRLLIVNLGRGADLFERYAFDPERGYLLVRYESIDPRSSARVTTRAVVTDARECSRGRWFPTHVVRVAEPDAAAGVLREVCTIRTSLLEADSPPQEADFTILLPDRLRISSLGARSSTQVAGSYRLSLSRLPEVVAAVIEKRVLSDDPPMQSPLDRPRPWRAFIIAVNAVVVLAIVARMAMRATKARRERIRNR